jgi:hypothetical protein
MAIRALTLLGWLTIADHGLADSLRKHSPFEVPHVAAIDAPG